MNRSIIISVICIINLSSLIVVPSQKQIVRPAASAAPQMHLIKQAAPIPGFVPETVKPADAKKSNEHKKMHEIKTVTPASPKARRVARASTLKLTMNVSTGGEVGVDLKVAIETGAVGSKTQLALQPKALKPIKTFEKWNVRSISRDRKWAGITTSAGDITKDQTKLVSLTSDKEMGPWDGNYCNLQPDGDTLEVVWGANDWGKLTFQSLKTGKVIKTFDNYLGMNADWVAVKEIDSNQKPWVYLKSRKDATEYKGPYEFSSYIGFSGDGKWCIIKGVQKVVSLVENGKDLGPWDKRLAGSTSDYRYVLLDDSPHLILRDTQTNKDIKKFRRGYQTTFSDDNQYCLVERLEEVKVSREEVGRRWGYIDVYSAAKGWDKVATWHGGLPYFLSDHLVVHSVPLKFEDGKPINLPYFNAPYNDPDKIDCSYVRSLHDETADGPFRGVNYYYWRQIKSISPNKKFFALIDKSENYGSGMISLRLSEHPDEVICSIDGTQCLFTEDSALFVVHGTDKTRVFDCEAGNEVAFMPSLDPKSDRSCTISNGILMQVAGGKTECYDLRVLSSSKESAVKQ